ncbi:MAG: polysaccharide deacetylase family protein [Bacillota bacterium]
MQKLKKAGRISKQAGSFLIAFIAIAALSIASLVRGGQTLPVDSIVQRVAVSVPIIMYHSILKDPGAAGDYVISPKLFEADMRYLKEHGYETVFIEDLIDYVYEDEPLPNKPVVVTLDDGYYNNLLYVLPILEKLDLKAVISMVGEFSVRFTEDPDLSPSYGYLNFEQIKELADSGRVEIQNHSYGLHSFGRRKGSMRIKGESLEQYREVFMGDALKLQELLEEKVGVVPTTYTYPFGLKSPETEDMLKEMGFLASMICYEKQNLIDDEESLFNLGRYNRPSGQGTESFMKRVLGGL